MSTKVMKIDKLDHYGRGITSLDDKITFVSNALPDEEVTLEIICEKKKYKEAKAKEIRKENEHRVTPKCPYYYLCGGCNIMHMDLEYQEEFKREKLQHILKKYAQINTDIKLIKNDRELFYRNKITLKVNNEMWGYYNQKTHQLVSIKSCLLAEDGINAIITDHEFLHIKNGEIVIRINDQKEILISIKSDDTISLKEENIPDSIIGIVNNGRTIYKKPYFYDKVGEYQYKISFDSFFQTNHYMTEKIFELLKYNLQGENLLDLYCGVGSLGISLKDNFKQIYGIEKIENAIRDAKENASLNEIKNSKYFVGDTGKIVEQLKVKFDTIVIDPPRSGLNKETMQYLFHVKPQNIAYVSCDPMTLARDLFQLKRKYHIKKVYALDMFPNTYHVECVCVLNRR